MRRSELSKSVSRALAMQYPAYGEPPEWGPRRRECLMPVFAVAAIAWGASTIGTLAAAGTLMSMAGVAAIGAVVGGIGTLTGNQEMMTVGSIMGLAGGIGMWAESSGAFAGEFTGANEADLAMGATEANTADVAMGLGDLSPETGQAVIQTWMEGANPTTDARSIIGATPTQSQVNPAAFNANPTDINSYQQIQPGADPTANIGEVPSGDAGINKFLATENTAVTTPPVIPEVKPTVIPEVKSALSNEVQQIANASSDPTGGIGDTSWLGVGKAKGAGGAFGFLGDLAKGFQGFAKENPTIAYGMMQGMTGMVSGFFDQLKPAQIDYMKAQTEMSNQQLANMRQPLPVFGSRSGLIGGRV